MFEEDEEEDAEDDDKDDNDDADDGVLMGGIQIVFSYNNHAQQTKQENEKSS